MKGLSSEIRFYLTVRTSSAHCTVIPIDWCQPKRRSLFQNLIIRCHSWWLCTNFSIFLNANLQMWCCIHTCTIRLLLHWRGQTINIVIELSLFLLFFQELLGWANRALNRFLCLDGPSLLLGHSLSTELLPLNSSFLLNCHLWIFLLFNHFWVWLFLVLTVW